MTDAIWHRLIVFVIVSFFNRYINQQSSWILDVVGILYLLLLDGHAVRGFLNYQIWYVEKMARGTEDICSNTIDSEGGKEIQCIVTYHFDDNPSRSRGSYI